MQQDSKTCKEDDYGRGMDRCSGIQGFSGHEQLFCAVCQCNRDIFFPDFHRIYLQGYHPPGMTPLPTSSKGETDILTPCDRFRNRTCKFIRLSFQARADLKGFKED